MITRVVDSISSTHNRLATGIDPVCDAVLSVADFLYSHAPDIIQHYLNSVGDTFTDRRALARNFLQLQCLFLVLLYLDYVTQAPGQRYYHCTSFAQYLVLFSLTMARRFVVLVLIWHSIKPFINDLYLYARPPSLPPYGPSASSPQSTETLVCFCLSCSNQKARSIQP